VVYFARDLFFLFFILLDITVSAIDAADKKWLEV